MASVHGKGATLTINSGAMTGFANEASLSRSVDTAETTVFGLSAKTFLPGLADGTFSGSGFYDKTSTTGSMAIMEAVYSGGAAVTCQYRPAGGGSGEYSYAFSAILTSWDITSSLGDAVGVSFSMQVTGAVTPTTI